LKQAVFLVGGRGERLGALTDDTPKPMLLVGGKPFLTYLIEKAVALGLEDIVLLAGYKGGQIAAHYAKNPVPGGRIRVVVEPNKLGTGGALWEARDVLKPRFLLANGDTLFDFNWLDLAPPATSDVQGVLALRPIEAAGRYSTVKVAGGRITAFGEPDFSADKHLINGGVYVLDREIALNQTGEQVSLEEELFPRIAAQGKLAGIIANDYFIDIGVPDDLERAQQEIPARCKRKAIFLDKNLLLSVSREGHAQIPEVTWTKGSRKTIRLCNSSGYLVFVLDQPGDPNDHISTSCGVNLEEPINKLLSASSAHINRLGAYPSQPSHEKILSHLIDWDIAARDCLLISAHEGQLEAAQAAQVPSHRFPGGSLDDFVHVIAFEQDWHGRLTPSLSSSTLCRNFSPE